jgi:hypothetical protein
MYNEFSIDNRTSEFNEDLFFEIYNKRKREYDNEYMINGTESENFECFYKDTYSNYLKIIPNEIKRAVADFRVFALRVVSQEVYDMLKSYSTLKEIEYKNIYDEYFCIFNRDVKSCSPRTYNALKYNIADLLILSAEITNQNFDIAISLGESDDYEVHPDILISLKNAQIIEQNENMRNNWIICKEVYFYEEKIEFHLLCDKSDAIILADDIELIDIK